MLIKLLVFWLQLCWQRLERIWSVTQNRKICYLKLRFTWEPKEPNYPSNHQIISFRQEKNQQFFLDHQSQLIQQLKQQHLWHSQELQQCQMQELGWELVKELELLYQWCWWWQVEEQQGLEQSHFQYDLKLYYLQQCQQQERQKSQLNCQLQLLRLKMYLQLMLNWQGKQMRCQLLVLLSHWRLWQQLCWRSAWWCWKRMCWYCFSQWWQQDELDCGS